MKGADYALRTDPVHAGRDRSLLVGFNYTGEVAVRPVMAVLYEDYGPRADRAQVKSPSLAGLKVVPYYGCLLVRPPQVAQFDDPDNPQVMAELLRAIGAEVMPWSHATDCCGAGLSLSRADVVQKPGRPAGGAGARSRGRCPGDRLPACARSTWRCARLRQPKMPAFYITELLGLAFGLPEAQKWWRKHLIDPRPVLQSAGVSCSADAVGVSDYGSLQRIFGSGKRQKAPSAQRW